jgi:hypothetical protein
MSLKHFLFLREYTKKKVEKVFQSDDGHDDDDGRHCHTCCTKEVSLSGSFHPIFLTLSVEKVKKDKKKKKKKWCADSFMAVGECTRRRRMESLVLFFFFLFYCVPTTLLVPPHLSLDISWQGE